MKNNLRVLRAVNNITQLELGKQVGVSAGAINLIENNKVDTRLSLAFKIAKYFNKTIEEIFII